MRSMMVRAGAGVMIVLVSVGTFEYLRQTKKQPEGSSVGAELARVEVVEASRGAVRREWQGYGTARAMDRAGVPAQVRATVVEVVGGLRPGAEVEAGQVMVKLDDTEFARELEVSEQAIADVEAQLSQIAVEEAGWTERVRLAEEAKEIAAREYERLRDAEQAGAAKAREVDAARAAWIAAELAHVNAKEALGRLPARRASLEAQRLGHESRQRIAKLNVERCVVRSPLRGVVEAVMVDEGESVQSGEEIARVVDVGRLEAALQIPSSARREIGVGDEVVLEETHGGAWERRERVARVSPQNNEATRTMEVYIVLEGKGVNGPDLAPGTFLKGTVRSSKEEERLVIPRRSIAEDRVMVIRAGVVRRVGVEVSYHVRGRRAETGLADEEWAVIGAGLEGGELVVVDGSRALRDGERAEAVLVDGGVEARRGAEEGSGARGSGASGGVKP